MTERDSQKRLFVSAFPRFEAEHAAPAWLATLRRAAIDRFDALGLPTRRREEWKYTNLAPLSKHRFISDPPARNGLARADVASLAALAPFGSSLVFVNGRFEPEYSTAAGLPAGVCAGNLANFLASEPERLRDPLARLATFDDRSFVALNTAFLQDGAFVHLSRNAALAQPLHVVHVATPAADPFVSQPRTLIVLDEGASAVVVESFVAAGDGVYLTNAVTEAAVGANAQLDYVKLQRESEQAFHIASLHVRQERASRFRSHSISLGAELSRNDIFAVLAAEGAECLLNGLFLTGGRQHVDNQTTIDHAKPHGTSRELYKGILGGRSRGVFNGKIIVRPDAQKTDARQSNRNLLLSDRAEIDTKPNLEIHADDVRCTHGSTIGHLDEDALFYLQSRGIPERASRRLLTRAFAAEIVDTLPTAPVREGVHELVDARLERGAIAEAA